ncbi:hypothetical protein DRN97_05470 [Methanosarcinales archaeon]|nr:MAG: hypothetical protein DRN97_05470 [Methanosarcinales archaeon]
MASFEYGFAFYKAFLLFKMHKIFIIGPFFIEITDYSFSKASLSSRIAENTFSLISISPPLPFYILYTPAIYKKLRLRGKKMIEKRKQKEEKNGTGKTW